MNACEKDRVYHFYLDNDAMELRKLCYPIISKFGGLNQSDYDDFYSIASGCLWNCVENFDETQEASLETFLYSCVEKKSKTEMTKRNRQKRVSTDKLLYYDAPVGDNEVNLLETLSDGKTVEDEVFSESDKIHDYLNCLSPKQRRFAEYIMQGFTLDEIAKKMNLTKVQTTNMLERMKSFEKVSKIKTINTNINIHNDVEERDMNTSTFEKSKTEKYTIGNLIKRIDNRTINFEHPLQRCAGQWTNAMKSDLVSDILQGNPIPALIFAEQIINGISVIFDLDGKQRCTTAQEFVNDQFKISKNVHRNLITYQEMSKDANGNQLVDENGIPLAEIKQFDIANKKYSQLPVELKEKFLEYCFDATLYLNCSDEDIAYHITRYNQGKAMNSTQKSVINLGEDNAKMVKAIVAMPFFQDGDFTFKQYKNGSIDRVVIESIMATYFLDDWKKNPEDIATFIKNNASIEMFENLEEDIESLQEIVTDETSLLFNAKNAFIWLAVFHKFKELNLEDEKFAKFLEDFANGLCDNKFGEVSFNDLDAYKNTKDKSVVVAKFETLINLMQESI